MTDSENFADRNPHDHNPNREEDVDNDDTEPQPSNTSSHEVSQLKRRWVPEWWGEECPVCGEPFDVGSTGIMFQDEQSSTDCVAWVRLCTAPITEDSPDIFTESDVVADSAIMTYVHKDEHIDL